MDHYYLTIVENGSNRAVCKEIPSLRNFVLHGSFYEILETITWKSHQVDIDFLSTLWRMSTINLKFNRCQLTTQKYQLWVTVWINKTHAFSPPFLLSKKQRQLDDFFNWTSVTFKDVFHTSLRLFLYYLCQRTQINDLHERLSG